MQSDSETTEADFHPCHRCKTPSMCEMEDCRFGLLPIVEGAQPQTASPLPPSHPPPRRRHEPKSTYRPRTLLSHRIALT